MLSLRSSDEIAYNGSNNTCRMDLFADTAADLTGVTTFDSIVLLAGSSALDISTGDLYIMKSDGTWILQPSSDITINVPDYDALENRLTAIETTKAGLKFTPETSSPSLTNSQRVKLTAANSNNDVEILIGKLNATTNYVQFYINGVDKGYITFDVSRNVDVWQ